MENIERLNILKIDSDCDAVAIKIREILNIDLKFNVSILNDESIALVSQNISHLYRNLVTDSLFNSIHIMLVQDTEKVQYPFIFFIPYLVVTTYNAHQIIRPFLWESVTYNKLYSSWDYGKILSYANNLIDIYGQK